MEVVTVVSAAPVESPQLTATPISEDTAAPEIETTPTETTPIPEVTETATADGQTETVDAPSEDEEPLSRERVNAMIEAAKRDTAAGIEGRHKQEVAAAQAAAEAKAAEAAYKQRLSEAAEVDNGAAVNALYDALNNVIDVEIDPTAIQRLQAQLPALGQMAQQLTRSTQTRIDRTYVDATNEYLTQNYPDYRIVPDVVSKFDAALVKGDFKARHGILLDIVKDAAITAATPQIRRTAAADLKKEADAALALQRQQSAERAANQNGGPTAVAGRPANVGGNYTTRREIDAAHVAGQITNAQRRELYSRVTAEF